MKEVSYSYYKELKGISLEEAEERVGAALKEQGFGVLTRIDVKETLKKKIDVDFKPYVILGACNPNLAHKALSTDDNIGLVLPCNVVVAEGDGCTEVSMIRPQAMFQSVQNPEVEPMMKEAEKLFTAAFEAI